MLVDQSSSASTLWSLQQRFQPSPGVAQVSNSAIDERISELVEETVREFGLPRAETKTDTIYARIRAEFRLAPDNNLWDDILVTVARRAGVYMTVRRTPEAVADARDSHAPQPRWEMLAVMVHGHPREDAVLDVRRLYEIAKGEGAAAESWTGRGRPPSRYRGTTKGA
jgi:hypothetical protein